MSVIFRAECRWQARAAIAAMREPDDKMQQAMALDQDQWAETHQTDVWRAMIDAALKEGQE